MVDVSKHENIELITYAEVKQVDGYIGNFHVTVGKKARYVIEEDSKLPEKTADVSSEFPPKFATGDLELETEKTAEAADADSMLKPRDNWAEVTAEMESPNREIQEMLKNHEEPLEEWKD